MLINIKYATRPQKVTERICQVAECFGIGIDENIEHIILDNYEFDESANVVYITGDSGGGKSSLLKELKSTRLMYAGFVTFFVTSSVVVPSAVSWFITTLPTVISFKVSEVVTRTCITRL